MKKIYDCGNILYGKPKPERYLNDMLLEEFGGDTEYAFETEDGKILMDVSTFDVGHLIRVNDHIMLIKDPRAAKVVDIDYGIDGIYAKSYGEPLAESHMFDYAPAGGSVKEHEYTFRFDGDNWVDLWGDQNKLLHYEHNYDVKVSEYDNKDGRHITRFDVYDMMTDLGSGVMSESRYTDYFTEYDEDGKHYVRFNDRVLVTYTDVGMNFAELDGRQYILGQAGGSKQYIRVNETEVSVSDTVSSHTVRVNDYEITVDYEERSITFDGTNLGFGSLDVKPHEELPSLKEYPYIGLGAPTGSPKEVPLADLPRDLNHDNWITIEHDDRLYSEYNAFNLHIVRFDGDEFIEYYNLSDERIIIFNGQEFSLTERRANDAEYRETGVEHFNTLYFNGFKYDFPQK